MKLSKSKIVAHRQCPKRLWLQMNQPELSITSGSTEMNFQVGNKVGEIARDFHDGGILIDGFKTQKVLAETNDIIHGKARPIFEGAFIHDDVLIRADLLLPVYSGYDLVEVKSSTGVKNYHIEDTTIQSWVINHSGLTLINIKLAHIDTSFAYQGGGDYRGLLNYADISEEVNERIGYVPEWVAAAKKTLAGNVPKIVPGEQCKDPFECPFVNHCNPPKEEVDGVYSPLILPYSDGKKLGTELIEEGFSNLCDVPRSRIEKPKHQRIHRVSKSGKSELNPAAEELLSKLPYPRYYIDFESINPAVPLWANSSPYQQIVFQWSCHIEQKNGEIKHHEYLSENTNDPRRDFAESLIDVLNSEGPVFVYFAGFEKPRIRELSEMFTDLSPALEAINERVVDLLPIARENYYHPDMKGSWSIKSVLPTIVPDLNYSNLDVADGGMAMQAFAEMIDEDTSEEQADYLRKSLLLYCERDTLAMVKLAHYFEGKENNA